MALKIRLTRIGARNKPFYRVVVTEGRTRRDGRFIEKLGFYDPTKNPAQFDVNLDRTHYWLQQGAKPSDTVRSLIKKAYAIRKEAVTQEVQSKAPEREASSEHSI